MRSVTKIILNDFARFPGRLLQNWAAALFSQHYSGSPQHLDQLWKQTQSQLCLCIASARCKHNISVLAWLRTKLSEHFSFTFHIEFLEGLMSVYVCALGNLQSNMQSKRSLKIQFLMEEWNFWTFRILDLKGDERKFIATQPSIVGLYSD